MLETLLQICANAKLDRFCLLSVESEMSVQLDMKIVCGTVMQCEGESEL